MMTNTQFNVAMDILTSYYGMPQWDLNPREGQDRDKIAKTWCDELGKYSVAQIQEACYWLTRKKKTMTFPSLPVLLNELFSKEPEVLSADDREPNRVYVALMAQKNINKHPEAVKRLICGRTIYRIYGVKVDGYKRADDTGFDNGMIPEYVKKEITC